MNMFLIDYLFFLHSGASKATASENRKSRRPFMENGVHGQTLDCVKDCVGQELKREQESVTVLRRF